MAAGEGSTESSCLPEGSREVAEAGSKEEERKDHMKRFRMSRGLPRPEISVSCGHQAPVPAQVPAHRRHVDIVWVAWVVIGAGSCFCGLGFSCENTHARDEPTLPLPAAPGAALSAGTLAPHCSGQDTFSGLTRATLPSKPFTPPPPAAPCPPPPHQAVLSPPICSQEG